MYLFIVAEGKFVVDGGPVLFTAVSLYPEQSLTQRRHKMGMEALDWDSLKAEVVYSASLFPCGRLWWETAKATREAKKGIS